MTQIRKFLEKVNSPRIVVEAMNLYGTTEVPGSSHNETILHWAKEIGGWISQYYTEDEIPWCGLFVGVCAKRAGFPFNQKLLGAKNWLDWGTPVDTPMLGDVLVFGRRGGGHVGLYVGEDYEAYHVLGGNQSNTVNVARLSKTRFLGARRCEWRYAQPKNVRPIYLSAQGSLSTNES